MLLAASTESAVQMHYAALGHRTNNIMRVLTALTAMGCADRIDEIFALLALIVAQPPAIRTFQ